MKEILHNLAFGGGKLTTANRTSSASASRAHSCSRLPLLLATVMIALFAVQAKATEVTVTISKIATTNSWKNKNAYNTFNIDDNITVSATTGNNNAKYYSNDNTWRLYQTESGKMTISAAEGYTINSVIVTFKTDDNGTLLDANNKTITSGTAVTVEASSVTFSASGITKGKVLVTGFTVTYTSSDTPSKTSTSVSFDEESYTFDVNSEDAKNFTGQTATVKDASGNTISDASVTYESSNTGLATVDATGKVSIVEGATGTATIKVSYNGDDTYNGSSASYTITVVNVVTNFADFMKTTEATKVTLTNAQVLYVKSDDMFVRDADGTCIDFYKSGLSFEAGDIISGSFTATYNFYKNLGPEATEITNISLTKSSNSTPEPVVVTSATVKDHLCDLIKLEKVDVTTSSSKYYVDDVQVYDKFNVKYTIEAGSYTLVGIAVVFNNSTYEICPIENPAENGEKDTEITLSESSLTYTIKNYTSFTAPTATVTVTGTSEEIADATVTYESSNTEVATVTDNVVTLTGVAGIATITVTYAGETDKYKSSTTTYTIKVTQPGIEFTFVQTSASGGTLSNEPEGVTAEFNNTYTSNKIQLTGGNSMTLTLSNLPIGYKVEGITLNVANNKSSGSGTATATVGENNIAKLNITGFGQYHTLTDMENVNCPAFTSESDSLVITISASVNSVYCDKFIIKLVPTDAAEKTSLTSSKKDWGTVCLPYTAQVVEGTKLYTVEGSSDEGIVVEEKTDGILVAGTPYIYKAAGSGYFYKASNSEVTEPVVGKNNLVGVLTASQLTGEAVDGIYILPSDGVWHEMGTGATVNLTKNRAYLTSRPAAVSEVKSSYSVIDTDEVTAINGVNADSNATAAKGIYTLAGQRVSTMTKGGIYIVNGKKVLVK